MIKSIFEHHVKIWHNLVMLIWRFGFRFLYLTKSKELLVSCFDSDIFCNDILDQVAVAVHFVHVLTFQIIYLSAKYIICIHLHYRNQPNVLGTVTGCNISDQSMSIAQGKQ